MSECIEMCLDRQIHTYIYTYTHTYIHTYTSIFTYLRKHYPTQVIAQYPWFLPALTEKALLLASAGEWEQSLDAAQRVLDLDSTNIDAVQIVAVHAFTQECHPHDSLQKLEDLDSALLTQEPSSVKGPYECAELFSCICSRHQRALQICLRLLSRAYTNCYNGIEESKILMLQGKIHLMQVSSYFFSFYFMLLTLFLSSFFFRSFFFSIFILCFLLAILLFIFTSILSLFLSLFLSFSFFPSFFLSFSFLFFISFSLSFSFLLVYLFISFFLSFLISFYLLLLPLIPFRRVSIFLLIQFPLHCLLLLFQPTLPLFFHIPPPPHLPPSLFVPFLSFL